MARIDLLEDDMFRTIRLVLPGHHRRIVRDTTAQTCACAGRSRKPMATCFAEVEARLKLTLTEMRESSPW